MDAHQIAWNEKAAKDIIEHLEKRRMEGSYAASATQARDEISTMIPKGASVYRCGSMTTTEIGLWEKLSERPEVKILNPYQPGLSPEQGMEVRRQGMTADVMIASSNAITLDGKLVNLDGSGNRIAAMAFGPKKVILVVGMNKVAPDLQSAMTRVKHYAAPVNVIRIGFKTPMQKAACAATVIYPSGVATYGALSKGTGSKAVSM
jgi:L-lactate utilization protein LutB